MKRIICKPADAQFDKETGISWARVNTDLGSIVAYAKIHPDEETPSKFAGCEYAERRAYIKYLKRKKKDVESRINELTNAIKAVNDIQWTNEIGAGLRRALRVLRDRLKRVVDEHRTLSLAIENATDKLQNDIDKRSERVKEVIKNSELRKMREELEGK